MDQNIPLWLTCYAEGEAHDPRPATQSQWDSMPGFLLVSGMLRTSREPHTQNVSHLGAGFAQAIGGSEVLFLTLQ